MCECHWQKWKCGPQKWVCTEHLPVGGTVTDREIMKYIYTINKMPLHRTYILLWPGLVTGVEIKQGLFALFCMDIPRHLYYYLEQVIKLRGHAKSNQQSEASQDSPCNYILAQLVLTRFSVLNNTKHMVSTFYQKVNYIL